MVNFIYKAVATTMTNKLLFWKNVLGLSSLYLNVKHLKDSCMPYTTKYYQVFTWLAARPVYEKLWQHCAHIRLRSCFMGQCGPLIWDGLPYMLYFILRNRIVREWYTDMKMAARKKTCKRIQLKNTPPSSICSVQYKRHKKDMPGKNLYFYSFLSPWCYRPQSQWLILFSNRKHRL